MCVCGHSRNEHLGGGAKQCMDPDCDCVGYENDEDELVAASGYDPKDDYLK